MKKYLMLFCALCLGASAVVVSSCKSDDDKVSKLEQEYFSVENGTYRDGQFPAGTPGHTLSGISVNRNALTGGMNFVTIVSQTAYKRFFVGVKDVPGYWEYDASTLQTSRAGNYVTYSIPVMMSTNYNSNMTMLISGEEVDGEITTPYEAQVNYVQSMSGDLNINLTFSNAKDVDLHLYMPDGEHIYYSHRGGTAYDSNDNPILDQDGNTVTYGLDIDSNAGCSIDNINNENIYIPADLLIDGTYYVKVDMYSNCDRSIPTSWSVIARYKGSVLPVQSGANPATGVYPVGCGNGDMTTVMTFTINNGNVTRSGVQRLTKDMFRPIAPTDMDIMKALDAEARMAK